ncbi:MAG: ADP-heptose:LPS heptosyltransferase [bacterium]|jgi:ADP-heptose:LPS heptosyltransferase
MKVDVMRKIDFFVGVPLCFIASLLSPIFLKKRDKKAKKKLLFIELSEMGSAILVDPAMRKAEKELDAELFFVIFKKNKPSLELLQTIKDENICTIREDSFLNLTIDTLKFLKWCREKGIDSVVDLELFSRVTALLTAFCGAKNRVGFYRFHNEGLYRGNMLTHQVSYNPHVHIAKNFIALINSLISDNDEVPYSKTIVHDEEIVLEKAHVPESDQKLMQEKVKTKYPEYNSEKHKIILINPNASELLIQRRWMPEYYVELISTILNNHEENLIVITGAPNEREEAQALKNGVGNDRCLNMAGDLKFEELPALYSIGHIMVSNDSGPPHFAAVTDLPTYVFFGPETPALYGSLGNFTPIYAGLSCSPCVSASNHRKTACVDNVCLKVIEPKQVYEMILPHFQK